MRNFLMLLLVMFFVGGAYAHSSDKNFTVVIDPGHGGRDPGALRGSIKEKDINLAIALQLGKMIEAMPDVNVIYTRKKDVFVELKKRPEIANKAKANLFISIHTNSTDAKTTRASGADTYIMGLSNSIENLAVAKRENSVIKYEDDYTTKYEGFDPDSPESYIIFEFMTNQHLQQSLDIATYIQKDIKGVAKRIDRGVRQAGFWVLKQVSAPSILIELGFINNPTEAKYLSSSQGQTEMAKAIFSGFKKYKDDYQKRGGVSPSANPTVEATPVSDDKPTNTTSVVARNEGKEYRVQFLYSMRKLPNGSPLFRGIEPTGYTKDNGYKYTVGATTNYQEALKLQREVRTKFSDAFVIEVDASLGERLDGTSSQAVVQSRPAVTATKSAVNNSRRAQYYIQFLISPQKLSDNSPRFKGLKDVTYYQDNGYKYIVGGTTNYQEILKLHKQVQLKFKDAFVIRMKDGKRL